MRPGPASLSRFVLASAILLAAPARAGGVCDYYRENAPHIYKTLCSGNKGSARPAGASSTFSSSFNISSASLPSEPSSYGLETIGSVLRGGDRGFSPSFALVKGFSKFGTGLSTGGTNTFYGDDVLQRLSPESDLRTFDPPEKPKSSLPHLNLGTSFRLARIGSGASLKLGTSLRYNRITAAWGGGPALALASSHFTLGAAVTRERISNFVRPVVFYAYQVSGRLSIFELEYNLLKNDSPFDQSPIHILTLTTTVRRMLLTAARRTLFYGTDADRHPVTQTHFAVQYLFSRAFSGGLLHNYIPGATSLGMQIYL